MIKIDSNFHPLMFCFSGFSGSGKTTLLAKLIPELKEFKIGYIKHDAHGFEMDKPGKDTFIMKKAGAEIVMINDQDHEAIISSRSCFSQEKNIFLDSDILLIEGHKYSKLPKIIIVDDELKILQEIKEGRVEAPMAFVSSSKTMEHCLGFNLPCFDRDDIRAVASFIREKVSGKIAAVPVYGLVLTGGASSRMKRDKGEINYHGISQVEFSYKLLKEFCSEVFVSCRKDQASLTHLENLPQIHDRFIDFGPLGGILSAMSTHRQAAWIVLACDLPMVNPEVIRTLLNERDAHQMATAFYHLDEKRFEPLAALYEPKSYHRMLYFLAEGKTCPQKVLYNSEVKIINFKNEDMVSKSLTNANTPEDYLKISAELK
jgi:molybdopterin-guanine dinucleotide biosynthesis protein A